jgi:cell filamentation protein
MTAFDSWDSYFTDDPRDPRIAEDQRVLRNLLGATSAHDLAETEKRVTLARVNELEQGFVRIEGGFDFDHHRAIHRHIFGDVYEWAGEPRTVDMSKTHRLWPAESIVASAPSVYGAIARDGFLRDMEPAQFAAHLGEHWGEVNVLHAFREGNTRSQRAFFSQLADQAGYTLDGTYLEQRYREFNTNREIAMLSGDSTQLGAFLRGAVSQKVEPTSVDPAWQARVAHLRGAAFPRPSSEATRSRPPTSSPTSQPKPGRQQDRGPGMGE